MKFRILQKVNVPMLWLLNNPFFGWSEMRTFAKNGLIKHIYLFRVSVSPKLPFTLEQDVKYDQS